MTLVPRRPAPRRVVLGVAAALSASFFGCGKSYDGVSDYDREQQAKQAAGSALASQGAKMKEVTYPGVGKAWSVDLSGVALTDDHLNQLKKAGRVSELNLSKSTVTDEQIAKLRELGVLATLNKLDLSQTPVTDASLGKLEDLPFLGSLNVAGTKVTATGIDKLKKSRQSNTQILAVFRNTAVKM